MKRSDIKKRPLTDTTLAALEPETKEYREAYGSDRLYFVVSASGKKRWEIRYKNLDNKWSWIGAGSYPDISAKLARKKALEVAELVSNGIDPLKEKTANLNTFKSVYDEWYQLKVNQGRAKDTLKGIRLAFENDVLPIIGHKRIDKIVRADCAEIQKKIEQRDALSISKKVRTWLNQIFGMAISLRQN